MTVSSIVPVNTYTGNSFCKKFDFDFLIESGSELIVQLTDENGETTTLKEGIDYSINEIGNKEGSYIIFPLETSSYNVLNENEKITLMLTLVIKQESEFRNSSYFNFNILEWTFDYIVRILQIINRKIERCVKVREGDNISPDNLINDIKDSEINTKNYFIGAQEYAKKALEYFLHSKDWAIKSDGKVQEEDFSSKYYALDAKESAKLAASYVSFHYVPFCVNRGNVEDGQPALFKLEGNILKTQGVFDITTAQGKFYDSLSDFSLDITNLPEGKYNIFIDPLERVITLKNNTVYLGNEFPSLAVTGDYLFNISSAPYNLEEKTVNSSEKEIGLVLAGTINISGNKKEIVVNPYNKNLQDFKIEQDILNNKVVRMFDVIPKDHILSFEEKEGLELLGEYVYKEAADGRYGYPDFYERCIKEYKEGTSNTTEVSGVTIKVHSNGHKFYNISDKAKIDKIYNDTKVAWYYGIDTANERILLPRNDWYGANITEAPVVGNGMALGLTNNEALGGLINGMSNSTHSNLAMITNAYGTKAGTSLTGTIMKTDISVGVSTDKEKSGLITNLSFASKEQNYHIYMVVGNTVVTRKITDIVQVTTSENDTLPLFTGMYFDFKPNHISWLNAGTQASGKIYESAYNELLKISKGEETKYGEGFKVVNEQEKLPDKDYSEYWIVNEDEIYFIAPAKSGINVETSTAKLYFKVANAVENIELLDTGRITEELSKLSTQEDWTWKTLAMNHGYTISASSLQNLQYIDYDLSNYLPKDDNNYEVSFCTEMYGTQGNDENNRKHVFYIVQYISQTARGIIAVGNSASIGGNCIAKIGTDRKLRCAYSSANIESQIWVDAYGYKKIGNFYKGK